MALKEDYYKILGIDRGAAQNDIKKAYRKMAKKYHPDTNAGDENAEERFKKISEAYSVLSDPEKKELYDRFGHEAFDGTGGNAGGTYGKAGMYGESMYGEPYGHYREYHFEGVNMDDILKDVFGGGFSDGFSGKFRTENLKQNGEDVEAEIDITFEEAVFGCDKFIKLSKNTEMKFESVKVHIPAGIDTGKIIRLKGRGVSGRNGGRSGDLLLKVNVGKKPGFERKGLNVYTTVRIPFTTAVLGGKAAVQTLYGKVMCNIAPGTQPGTKLRIKNKGIVSMKNPAERGCHYAAVEIQVPKNISDEAKKKLEEFNELCKKTSKAA